MARKQQWRSKWRLSEGVLQLLLVRSRVSEICLQESEQVTSSLKAPKGKRFIRQYEHLKSYGLVKTKTAPNFLTAHSDSDQQVVWTSKLRWMFILQLIARFLIEATFFFFFYLIQAQQHNNKLEVSFKFSAVYLNYSWHNLHVGLKS